MLAWPTKDPSENLDYAIDFVDVLGSDAIATKSVAATGVTAGTSSIVGTKVNVWLSGGTAGTTGAVTITITTAGGRTIERSATIYVDDL